MFHNLLNIPLCETCYRIDTKMYWLVWRAQSLCWLSSPSHHQSQLFHSKQQDHWPELTMRIQTVLALRLANTLKKIQEKNHRTSEETTDKGFPRPPSFMRKRRRIVCRDGPSMTWTDGSRHTCICTVWKMEGRKGMLDCRQCQNFRFFLYIWGLEV